MSALSTLAAGAEAAEAPGIVVNGAALAWAEIADRVAALLPRLPPGEGPVPLLGSGRLSTLLGALALIEAGRPVVPLHPRLSSGEQARQRAALGLGEAWAVPEAAGAGAWPAPRAVDPERPLAVLFSSGSTATPGAVLLSRRAFLASAAAHTANLPFLAGDRWALAMPLGHVGGLSILVRCLIARSAVSLWEPPAGQDGVTFSADRLLDQLAADGSTLLSLVPTMLAALLETGRARPPRLRAVLLGGAAAPPALLLAAAARGWPVLPTYGLTEACSQLCTAPPGGRPDPAMGVGPPLPGVQLRIVDGEVQARGAMLCSGYAGGDRPSPFTADGWLRTGDLGVLDAAGRLHLRGRLGEGIITGGENVSPAEVEAALSGCPGLRGVVVFGLPDPVYGERVAAAVVVAPGVTDAALDGWARERLASFRRPRVWIRLAALPIGGTGKVDRRAAAALARAQIS